MKSWKFNPNLHLSPHRHHLLFAFFLIFLFACFMICLPSSSLAYLVACHVSNHMLCLLHLYVCLLYTHCALSTHLFLSIACLLDLCLCMYTHGVRMLGAKAWSPKHKQKGCECKHVDMSQEAMFNRFKGIASPIWLCTLLNLIPSSLISLLDGLYQVYHAMNHSSLSLEYGDPCLLSYSYILGHAQGMQAFTFHLCVLEMCMMYVYIYIYIYLLTPFGVIVIVHVT